MSRKRFDQMHCGVAQALEQVGDWWTLLIVRDAFIGSRRFADFHEGLGIAKNILSNRLRRLVADGILSRQAVGPGGRRYEYELTQKGRDLWLVMTALRLWSDKWVFGKGEEPVIARDRKSGSVLAGLLAVDQEGRPLNPHELRLEPGPGAAPEDLAAFENTRR